MLIQLKRVFEEPFSKLHLINKMLTRKSAFDATVFYMMLKIDHQRMTKLVIDHIMWKGELLSWGSKELKAKKFKGTSVFLNLILA